jgi:excinuclease UvrABC nuclease subunit
MLIGFCHSHPAFGTFRDDEVVDEKNRVITPSFKGRKECLQHPKRLCVIVVVKGCAAEVDTSVTDRLWRVIIVELMLDAVAKIMSIAILQLLQRAVLDGERKVFEFLGVLSV